MAVLLELKSLFDRETDRYSANSGMSDTVGYDRNQWSKLMTYNVDYGQTRTDENLTEQAIRPCKFGAKSWLFVGSPIIYEEAARSSTRS